MERDKTKRILIRIIPSLIFLLIFSFSLACGAGEPSKEKLSIPEEEGVEGKKIIGYRDTELQDKVPVVEWEIGEPIVFRNGLKATLNKVLEERRLEKPYVVINVTLENTTDKVQEDWIIFTMSASPNVWDSEDNIFSGWGSLFTGEGIWDKIDKLSPGENKKWPPGKELTGNIYFDVSGNTGGLMLELEYSEFIRPNVIYRYVLKDTEAKTEEDVVIPTELEAREKIEEGVYELPILSSDREFIRQVADWLPADWQNG